MSTSWVPDVAAESPFSLANIPFGIITTARDTAPHAAIAIGSYVLDLKVLSGSAGFWELLPGLEPYKHVFSEPTLNAFAALGRATHRQVRSAIQRILASDTDSPHVLKEQAGLRTEALLPQASVELHLPMSIGDYTDFYAGYHHAYGVGLMFRGPANALQPNYTHLPVGYHGRSSSIVVSGRPIRRPVGQIILDPDAEPKQPVTAPCRKLDFELELACFISKPNALGRPVAVEDAEEHIFGYVLLNDWSARDIQTWEYVPLGPFNSKNFASTISPWVVLADALEPFRTRSIENKTVLQKYLREDEQHSVFDIRLQVELMTPNGNTSSICEVSSKYLLWSFPQMIAHHTLGGCALRSGDLLGSGTISGTGPSEKGSLLEMSENGKKDILVSGVEVRRFLNDGDSVRIRGLCGKDGARVGFGDCIGTIHPTVT